MVAYHRRRVRVPTREDGHPSARPIHSAETLHHVGRQRSVHQQEKRHLSAVDVPHAEVHIHRLWLISLHPAIGKAGTKAHALGIGHIAKLARKETRAVKRTIKLPHLGRVGIGGVDHREALVPPIGVGNHHSSEVEAIGLGHAVVVGLLPTGERSGCGQHNGLVGLALKGEPNHRVVDPRTHERIGIFQRQVPGETSPFAPPLVDAVNRIGSVDTLAQGIEQHRTLTLVAIGPYHDVHLAIHLGRDAQQSRVRQGRQFDAQTLTRQSDAIVMGMTQLIGMVEGRGALLHPQAHWALALRHDGKRPIVLRASAHQPMTAANALQQTVGIIIWRHTFALCGTRLRCPEVLSVGHQHSRQRLSVLLRSLAVDAFRSRNGLVGTHLGIDFR